MCCNRHLCCIYLTSLTWNERAISLFERQLFPMTKYLTAGRLINFLPLQLRFPFFSPSLTRLLWRIRPFVLVDVVIVVDFFRLWDQPDWRPDTGSLQYLFFHSLPTKLACSNSATLRFGSLVHRSSRYYVQRAQYVMCLIEKSQFGEQWWKLMKRPGEMISIDCGVAAPSSVENWPDRR